MGALIDWISQPKTAGATLLVAMPGVGDVGKLAIDAVNCELDAEPVARIIHPSLPPLAKLDDDGLLSPPHICLLYTSPSPRDMRRSRMPSSA